MTLGSIGNSQTAAEGNSLIKFIFENRRNQHRHNITSTGGKTGNSNILGVTTELLDIFAYPVQGCSLVKEAEVTALFLLVTICQSRQIIKAKKSQAILYGNINHVAFLRQPVALHQMAVAVLIIAAVNINQYRQILFLRIRAHNIQRQHALLPKHLFAVVLDIRRCSLGAVQNSLMLFSLLRLTPAVSARRLLRIRNTQPLYYLMLVVISTGNNTLLGFYFIIKIGSLSSSCKNACRQQRSNHILHLFHLYHLLPHRNLLNTYFLL